MKQGVIHAVMAESVMSARDNLWRLNLKHVTEKEIGFMTNEKMLPEVPDNVIKSFARCLLPAIREYFKSEEGQREYAKWMSEKKKLDSEKSKNE